MISHTSSIQVLQSDLFCKVSRQKLCTLIFFFCIWGSVPPYILETFSVSVLVTEIMEKCTMKGTDESDLVQPHAQSRSNNKVRAACAGPGPVRF